ncbi:MAG: sigma-70 family RNA polymerase sigma factor [Pseudomonadota bacterium]
MLLPMGDSTNPDAASDQDLVRRMLSGEQAAFDAFFGAHAARLAAFASRRSALDAAALEDVVQQSLIKAIRNLAQFRGESTLHTWLCQICRNVLADIRRKADRQPRVESLEAAMEKSAALPVQLIDYRDPLEACADDSTRAAIRRTINALPPRYSQVLELKYGDELPIEQIARQLSLTESAAQSLLARARRAFAEQWLEQAEDSADDARSGFGVP